MARSLGTTLPGRLLTEACSTHRPHRQLAETGKVFLGEESVAGASVEAHVDSLLRLQVTGHPRLVGASVEVREERLAEPAPLLRRLDADGIEVIVGLGDVAFTEIGRDAEKPRDGRGA